MNCLPLIRLLAHIFQLLISKVVHDIKDYHGSQRLSWFGEQSICSKHHGGERGAKKTHKEQQQL